MSLPLPINKDLRCFFLADIISQFGSGISLIGLNWFLIETTGMSAKVGILMAISVLSGLISLPFAGVITDGFNRKSILIYTNYIRAFFILLTAIALWCLPFSLYYIYFLSAIGGIGWNIYFTSSRTLIQEISVGNLLKGNSMIEISLQAGMFSAGAVAGLVYKFFGIEAILIINIITFVVGGSLLYGIKSKGKLKPIKRETFTRQFTNGFKYLKNHPMTFGFGVMILLPFVATITLNVVLAGYVGNYLKGDSLVFGLSDMFYGIGASLSGLIVIGFSHKYAKKYIIMFFFFISLVSIVVMLPNKFFIVVFIATLFYGLSSSGLRIVLNSVLMEVVPAEYMGRSMSIWGFVSGVLQLLAVSTVGIYMDKVGARFGYLYLLVIILTALIGYLYFSKNLRDTSGKLVDFGQI